MNKRKFFLAVLYINLNIFSIAQASESLLTPLLVLGATTSTILVLNNHFEQKRSERVHEDTCLPFSIHNQKIVGCANRKVDLPKSNLSTKKTEEYESQFITSARDVKK